MRKIQSLKTTIRSSPWRRRTAQQRRSRVEALELRAMLSGSQLANVGDVFYILMENHNLKDPYGLVPPAGSGDPEQLLNNPAAPYLNSLVAPGNPNAAQTSYATDYENVVSNNAALHPSEPNYVWGEAGLTGPNNANDGDPYDNVTHTSGTNTNNIVNAENLTDLLQKAGISWKTYLEDIDLTPSSGSVNQPGANSLTNNVAPQGQWTVPLEDFSGSSSAYVNPYNGSNDYGFSPRHDGQLYFAATNGSTSVTPDLSPSNSEVSHYSPLQQLQADLNNDAAGRYNVITPDLYNDMHTPLPNGFTYKGTKYTGDQASIAQGDNFLSTVIPMIEASQAYKNNGAIVIWFDEAEPDASGPQNPMVEIVISPLAKGNAYSSTLMYTHSSDLKTMQELFNVPAPGGGFLGDANAATTNDLSDLFKSDISGTGVTVAVSVGGTFSGKLATFADVDGDANPADFTATIDWGDGTSASPDTSAGTVSGGAGGLSVTGSHTYANEGNYTATVTINDTADGATATINAEILANPHAVYVSAVYQDVLGRAPDGGGLVFWSQKLDAGGAISSVAVSIGHSAEYYGSFVIKPDYLKLLGRAADATGLQFWTTQMLNGVTDQQLAAGFIASDEFFANAGGTDLDWVDSVYQLLLGRPADQSGATFWTGQLSSLEMTESGAAARSQVAVRISTSQENNTNLINDDYEHYLGRAADSQGLQFWLSQFAAGKTNEDVIAGFTGSAEYYEDKTGTNP